MQRPCVCGGASSQQQAGLSPEVQWHIQRLHNELEQTRRDNVATCQAFRDEISRLQERCSALQTESLLHKARVSNAVTRYLQSHAHSGATSIPIQSVMTFFQRVAQNGATPQLPPGARKRGREAEDEEMMDASVSKRAAFMPTRCAGVEENHSTQPQQPISASGSG